MKTLFQKIFNAVSGRFARNVYFWLLFMSTRVQFGMAWWKVWYACVLFALMMIQVYFNNFFLVPRLLAKRKYGTYFTAVAMFTLIVAYGYAVVVKTMLSYHPGTYENAVSLFVPSPLNNPSAFADLLHRVLTNYFVLLALTFIFTMGWYMGDYSRQQKRLEEADRKRLETELIVLKGQINPHFLFNTLNNLYGLAIKKADQTPDAIMKLSAILRYLLYESDTDVVSFDKEKEVMQAYIDLEMLRLSSKDNLHFSISADAPYSLPPLLWLPVLENVFKHGTRFISEDHKIDYRFSIQNDKLTIYSRNNYKQAVHANGMEPGSGIGLSNLKHRLDILYPGNHKINTRAENDIYTTNVEISLK